MQWGGWWDGGSGWGTHVNPWLIHVNVWQKPLQYCKLISLQLIKIKGKKSMGGRITIKSDLLSTSHIHNQLLPYHLKCLYKAIAFLNALTMSFNLMFTYKRHSNYY